MNGAQRAAIRKAKERRSLAAMDESMGGREARLEALYGRGAADKKEPLPVSGSAGVPGS